MLKKLLKDKDHNITLVFHFNNLINFQNQNQIQKNLLINFKFS